MDAIGIRDEESLRAWLEGRPREDAIALSCRIALRSAHVFWQPSTTDRLIDGDRDILVCRCILVSMVASLRPSVDIIDAANRAAGAYRKARAGSHKDGLGEAGAAAQAAAGFAAQAIGATTDTNVGAAAAAYVADVANAAKFALDLHERSSAPVSDEADDTLLSFSPTQFWTEVQKDASRLDLGEGAFVRPLYYGGRPYYLDIDNLEWRWRAGGWDFWADWYVGHLHGRPLDLELLEKVALIPSDDWDKGADHINAIIAALYEAHMVAQAAAKLDADLLSAVFATPGMGHNHPPEDIADPPLAAIRQPLHAIRNEALAPRPDKDVVRGALEQLQNALALVGRYVGRKLDLAVDEFSKAGGKAAAHWGVPALILWLAKNQPEFAEFIQQVTRWLAGL